MPTIDKVQSILKEIKPTKDLSGLTDIVDGGYIDSFELLLLISHLSEAFSIEIGVDDIIPENFNSAEQIAAMVERLMK